MKKLLAFLFTLQATAVYASPSCLKTQDCFEHNGQIIDLRSTGKTLVDDLYDCDPLQEDCLKLSANAKVPTLDENEFKKIVGRKGTEYFIPIDVESSDLHLLTGALSLGTVVFANDRAIMDFVQDNKTDTLDQLRTIGNIMGREAILPMVAGAYFMGAVMDNGKLKKVGLFGISTAIATQIVTEAFKKSFRRERPNASGEPYEFFEGDNYSFFSGHTSAAFSLATVVAEVYKDKPVVPYIAYGVAALTSYARMHDEKHWASDVLAGAVAGHLITKIIMRTFENRNKPNRSGLVITPMVGSATGVEIEWRPEEKRTELECSKSNLEGREKIKMCMDEIFANSN